jgi:hypothetical protein
MSRSWLHKYLVKGNIMRKIVHYFCKNFTHPGVSAADAQEVMRSLKIDVRMSNIVRKRLNGVSCFSFHPLLFHSISQLPSAA